MLTTRAVGGWASSHCIGEIIESKRQAQGFKCSAQVAVTKPENVHDDSKGISISCSFRADIDF